VEHAALAAEAELDLAAVDLHVAVAQRGQAERFIGARVFLVPDPHHGHFQQAHDGGQHLLARQAGQVQRRSTAPRIRGSALPKLSMRSYLTSSRTLRQRGW
jgi:hypothetical protein